MTWVKFFRIDYCLQLVLRINLMKDLRVYILEDNLPLSKTSCELHEDHWILKLKTKEPFGMNSYVNSLVKSFYELF